MKHDQMRRFLRRLYAGIAAAVLMTGFTSIAAEVDMSETNVKTESFRRDLSGSAGSICGKVLGETKETIEAAHEAYLAQIEERKAEEEAKRLAEAQMASVPVSSADDFWQR